MHYNASQYRRVFAKCTWLDDIKIPVKYLRRGKIYSFHRLKHFANGGSNLKDFITFSDKSDELLKHFSFIQESLYKLKRTCCEFISYKKHFIHGMYEAWMRTMKDANNFFFTERLNTTALSILRNKKDTKRINSFVSEFVHLRNILDTKDSKFMFRWVFQSFLLGFCSE